MKAILTLFMLTASFMLRANEFNARVSLNHLSCQVTELPFRDLFKSNLVLFPRTEIFLSSEDEYSLQQDLKDMTFESSKPCSDFDVYELKLEATKRWYGYIPAVVKIHKESFSRYLRIGEVLVAEISIYQGQNEVIFKGKKVLWTMSSF